MKHIFFIFIIVGLAGYFFIIGYVTGQGQERIITKVKTPDKIQSKIVRINNRIDYMFYWFPWGPYTAEEIEAEHNMTAGQAREYIRQETCGKK